MLRLKILLSVLLLLITGCSTQKQIPITTVEDCPKIRVNPIFSVIPNPNYEIRLREVWISSENVMK